MRSRKSYTRAISEPFYNFTPRAVKDSATKNKNSAKAAVACCIVRASAGIFHINYESTRQTSGKRVTNRLVHGAKNNSFLSGKHTVSDTYSATFRIYDGIFRRQIFI